MWRKIDMRNDGLHHEMEELENMCHHAVDRSGGNLVDITVEHFGTDDLLKYITDSSSGIKHLRLLCCEEIATLGLCKVASKLHLLEELEITLCIDISHEAVAVIGRSCPLLKSFKFNKEWCTLSDMDDWFEEDTLSTQNDDDLDALAIARTMHGLHHLHLYGNKLTDDGLRKILDFCPHLESLDLRRCFNLNMGGDLEVTCAERIEKLWLPHDSTVGKGFAAESDGFCFKWTELPDDVTLSILSRVGAIDILESVQDVCMKWHRICADPIMWRIIDMRNNGYEGDIDIEKMSFHAVDRSCGNLVDFSINHFGTSRLLKYITDRSSRIKRLHLALCKRITDNGLSEVAPKLPLLEDLEISLCSVSSKSIELIGRSCPLLKSFKWNRQTVDDDARGVHVKKNEDALAIARTMHGLHHLQLFGNQLTNEGLKEILDLCSHLEALDLRHCFNLNLRGHLGRRCSEQIKKLRLPHDSIADSELRFTVRGYGSPRKFNPMSLLGFPDNEDYDEYGYGLYNGYCSDNSDWYDDFTKPSLEDLLGLDEEDLEFFGLGKAHRMAHLQDFYDFGDSGSDDEMFY